MSDSISNDAVTHNSNINDNPNSNTQYYVTRSGRTVRPPQRYGMAAQFFFL